MSKPTFFRKSSYELPDGLRVASWKHRLIADFIDMFFVLPLLVFIAVFRTTGEGTDPRLGSGVTIGLTLYGIYEVGLTAFGGQTLGKKATGIVLRSRDGSPVKLWQAFARWALKLLTPIAWVGLFAVSWRKGLNDLVSVGQFVVVASIFLSSTRRGIHDLLARTVVVEKMSKIL